MGEIRDEMVEYFQGRLKHYGIKCGAFIDLCNAWSRLTPDERGRCIDLDDRLEINREVIMNFPETIFIKRDNKYVEYHKDYENEKGGCYYRNDDEDDWLFGCGISLYPDGHLTYLFKGREEIWNTEYKLQEV